MDIKPFLDNIRELIANDDLPTALQQLRDLLDNSPKLNEVIFQAARFEDIRRQIRLGLVSHAEANLTQNQIRAGLLDLLQEVEGRVGISGGADSSHPLTKGLRAEVERAISIVNSKNVVTGNISAGGNVVIGDTTVTESQTSRRLRLFLFLFVPVLAIAGAFVWYRLQEMQRPLSLKVRVENRTPNPELPEPEGKLTLTYGSKSEPKEASTATEALFEGIPANFKEQNLRLRFEAKGFVSVDTTFLLEHEKIVLPVRRNDDLAKIPGVISDDSGRPLEGVKISIACCSAMTDASGAFTLRIPFEHQRMSQRLDIFKEGFAAKSITTPVIPGEAVRLTLERQ